MILRRKFLHPNRKLGGKKGRTSLNVLIKTDEIQGYHERNIQNSIIASIMVSLGMT